MGHVRCFFLAGLFLTTFSTLALELLDTRLLSVLAWYHLSFFAVSTAMFGMSAGAVRVYLGGAQFEGEGAARELARYALFLTLSIPVCHLIGLCIPLHQELTATTIVAFVLVTLTLAIPFYLSGVVVAIALTRIPGPSGLVYAVDLGGAALGAIAVVPMLEGFDVTSATLLTAATAAASAACFRLYSGERRLSVPILLGLLLVFGAFANSQSPDGLRVAYPKGRYIGSDVLREFWTIHGQVVVHQEKKGRPPFYWARGPVAPLARVDRMRMVIDGEAETYLTRWDGSLQGLEWVKQGITALPYHLRKGGDVGVVGVGGGRDLLNALWGRSRSVEGIEVNSAFVEILTGPLRKYAGLADRPEVTLIHDEARSYLTRTNHRYDVLQMSLIDTWAATGAGAFTLSENGLYTVEAWKIFFDDLKPHGVFSVSRWYSPRHASETSRLLSLATATLIERGAANPNRQLILVARDRVANLLSSVDPFSAEDLARIRQVSQSQGFEILLAPDQPASNPLLRRIVASRSLDELDAVIRDEPFDYSPPRDVRPYFFNLLKPDHIFDASKLGGWGILQGNLRATRVLVLLWMISAALVAVIIVFPLLRSGLPAIPRASFFQAMFYFALIGAGYMLAQIALMQRLSVYLGHPTYSVTLVLFSMILATGVGSLVSDRVPLERHRAWVVGVSISCAVVLLGASLAIQPMIDATVSRGLPTRAGLAILLVSSMAFPLGFCFPLGLRLVSRISQGVAPWAWGVNGAFGVLASVSAVAISMWSSIQTNLFLASISYALLAIPALALSAAPRMASGRE